MPDMLTRTGLGGRHPTTLKEYPVAALRESLKLSSEAATAWAVIERTLKDVSVNDEPSNIDLLYVVEEAVKARANRAVEDVVEACAKLRADLTDEQKAMLAARSGDVRALVFS